MKPVSKFINRSGSLDRIRQSTNQLESLARQLRAILPPDAAAHLVGCALRSETVVVFCDSAAWAAQLRYFQQSILDACHRTSGDKIRRVQFRILPPETPAGNPPTPELTESARRVVEQAANGIADNELAEALRRLSLKTPDQDAD